MVSAGQVRNQDWIYFQEDFVHKPSAVMFLH
jgi:hypothetical protein